MNLVKCLTYTVKQLSSRAVFQEEVHSWTLFPMPKKTYNVGMAKYLLTKSTYTDILLAIAKCHTQTYIFSHI